MMALIFGIKIINLKKYYKKLNQLQHKYITTMIGTRLHSDNVSIRILLGIPNLSDFIIKLKLTMYYNIFKNNDNNNIFYKIIKSNYIEIYNKYKHNNNSIKKLKNQWAYLTIDYIQTINAWDIDNKYLDINNLPNDKKIWLKLINNKYSNIYQCELNKFLSKNGRILTMIYGYDILMNKYKNKPYHGFFDEINKIYNGNISTSNIKKSIKILFNWTKLNYLTINNDNKLTQITNLLPKRCPFCGNNRSFVAYHLIWLCPRFNQIRHDDLGWIGREDFTKNLDFIEEVQTEIDSL